MSVAVARPPGGMARLWPIVYFALSVCASSWAQNIRIPDLGTPEVPVAPEIKPGEPCGKCGVIQSIREVGLGDAFNAPQPYGDNSSSLGSSQPVGAVISIPFGPGSDKAYVGGAGTSEIRKRLAETQYEITIKLDTGGYTLLRTTNGLAYHVGDPVRVEGTQIQLIVP